MKKLIITALTAVMILSSSLMVMAAPAKESTYYCTEHEKYDSCPYDGECPFGSKDCVVDGECSHSKDTTCGNRHSTGCGHNENRSSCANSSSNSTSNQKSNGGHHGRGHH